MKGWIQTQTGKFDFEEMGPIKLLDIVHSLSMLCRFNGYTNSFYSVAQHCMVMAENAIGADLKRFCLLHDAAEAYIGDIPAPLKKNLPTIEEYELKLLAKIYKKYIHRLPTKEEQECIYALDQRLLATEVRDLFDEPYDNWTDDLVEFRKNIIPKRDVELIYIKRLKEAGFDITT